MKQSYSTVVGREVQNIVTGSKVPLCANDVYEQLINSNRINTHKSTVYRRLQDLVSRKILQSSSINNGVEFYEMVDLPNTSNKIHLHFICKNCNKIECEKIQPTQEKNLLESLAKSTSPKRMANFEQVEIKVFRNCNLCAKIKYVDPA